jgi:hypothetical protein
LAITAGLFFFLRGMGKRDHSTAWALLFTEMFLL